MPGPNLRKIEVAFLSKIEVCLPVENIVTLALPKLGSTCLPAENFLASKGHQLSMTAQIQLEQLRSPEQLDPDNCLKNKVGTNVPCEVLTYTPTVLSEIYRLFPESTISNNCLKSRAPGYFMPRLLDSRLAQDHGAGTR